MNNETTKKTFNYNYLSVILIYIWSLAFLILTPDIKEADSRMFPYIVSGLSIVLATGLLLKTYFGWGKKKETMDFSGSGLAFLIAAVMLVYVGAIHVAGFYLSTPFYLYISMLMLGQKNKKVMIIVSLLTPILVYVFFRVLLSMQIPEGILVPWFKDNYLR